MPAEMPHRSTPLAGRRFLAAWWRVLLAVMFLANPGRLELLAETPESQRKARLIGRLARFVEWPKEKSAMGVPLVIGVYGNDTISDQIREVASRQKINGRDVVVRNLTTVQEINSCHILFVPASAERDLASILYTARGEPVLTVGESPAFLKKGGTVNITTVGQDISWVIDPKNAKRSELKLNPLLFNLGDSPFGG